MQSSDIAPDQDQPAHMEPEIPSAADQQQHPDQQEQPQHQQQNEQQHAHLQLDAVGANSSSEAPAGPAAESMSPVKDVAKDSADRRYDQHQVQQRQHGKHCYATHLTCQATHTGGKPCIQWRCCHVVTSCSSLMHRSVQAVWL